MKKFRFSNIYKIGMRFPFLVLSVAVLMTGFAIYYAKQLNVETDFSKLLPKDTPSVQNFEDFKKTFGSLGFLYLTVEGPDPDRAERFADLFVSRIEKLPAVRYVNYRKPVDFFKKRKWLYLELEDIEEMERRVDRSLELAKEGVSPVFSHLMDFADEEDRPDLTFEDIKEKYKDKFQSQDTPLVKGEEEDFIIIRVKSYKGSEDFDDNLALITDVQSIEKALKAEKEFSDIEVGYSGHYMSSLETVDLIRRELAFVSIGVAILLALILYGYFRRFSGAFLVGIPLVMAVSWTGGLIFLMLGYVNILTAFGFSILAGLGSDYGIYLLARFFREKDSGVDFPTACDRAFAGTGKGIQMAVFTTMAAFGALFFSKFEVFFELGLVGFIGLFLNFLAMMILLPAMLRIAERHPKSKWVNWFFGWKHKKDFLPWEAKPIIEKIFHPSGARVVVFGFVLLALVSSLTVPEVRQIVYNETQTEFENLPSTQLHQRILKALGASLHPTAIMVEGENQERKLVRGVNDMLEKSENGAAIFKKVFALSSFIPSDQEKKIEILTRLIPKYKENQYVNKDQRRKFAESVQETLDVGVIKKEILPKEILRNFISLKDPNSFVVYLFASISRGTKEGMHCFNRGVYQTLDFLGVKGRPVENSFVFSDILNILEKESVRGFLFILTFMFAILFFTIRNVKRTLLIFATLMGAFLILSGVMYLVGIRLTILNICVFPILLGTGIDCFIHFSHHFDESGNLIHTISSDVPPILTSNLTSIVGFGGLLFTSGVGLRSIGWIAVTGLVVITLVCVFIFPRILSIPAFSSAKLLEVRSKHSEA